MNSKDPFETRYTCFENRENNITNKNKRITKNINDRNVYKIVAIGDSSVGKTTILKRYSKNPTESSTVRPTVGIDFRTMEVEIDGKKVRANIWDTMGRHSFRTMTKNFFSKTDGVLLLYDVTNRTSFDNLHRWIRDIKESKLHNKEIFLLANKIDAGGREVSAKEGKCFANSFGMKYFEVSARTGENVR